MSIPAFPTFAGIAWPVKRSPLWNSITQKPISGKDTILSLWSFQRYKFDITFSYLSQADWQNFEGFFNGVNGTALPFHFNDPNDNSVTGQSIGTGDGTTTAFNFIRTLGGFICPTQDVTQAGVVVNLNGTPTAAYTFLTDPNWGFTYGVNFNSAPGSGVAITASFNYNWPCRFDADNLDFEEQLSQMWALRKCSFTSLKVV
jgi:uncharacterized protein (TIGR02217 family)